MSPDLVKFFKELISNELNRISNDISNYKSDKFNMTHDKSPSSLMIIPITGVDTTDIDHLIEKEIKRFNEALEIEKRFYEQFPNKTSNYCEKLDKEDDGIYIISVQDFKSCCEEKGFVDYDGFGHPVKDNKVSYDIIKPSKCYKIPEDATHIAWYNR